jgi:hypothetical protein
MLSTARDVTVDLIKKSMEPGGCGGIKKNHVWKTLNDEKCGRVSISRALDTPDSVRIRRVHPYDINE